MIWSKITFIVLIFSLIVMWKRYRIRILLHPSLYFLVTWIISVISFEIFLAAGFTDLIIDKNILDELFVYVSFTALCFVFFSRNDYKTVRKATLNMVLNIPNAFFKYFSIGFFLIAFVKLFFISGFNLATNRALTNIETYDFYNRTGHFGFVEVILNILNMLIIPFIIYGGWVFGNLYFRGIKKISVVVFLPLITSIMNVLTTGGRAGIISSFTFFVLGLFFALFSQKWNFWNRLKKLIKYGLLFLLIFSAFSTYVSKERSKNLTMQNEYLSSIQQFIYLKPFYGILEYSIFHFQGYQWRRIDSTTPQLELGQTTFSFITDFSLPVVSQLMGERITLQKEFHLKDIDPVRNSTRAEEENLPGPNITATVYYILYDDFGYYGVFVITFLFVWFTEFLYRKLFLKFNANFWSIILFIAVYKLWTQTIFSHHLSGSWFNAYLYPILLIEIVNYLTRRNVKSEKVKPKRNIILPENSEYNNA